MEVDSGMGSESDQEQTQQTQNLVSQSPPSEQHDLVNNNNNNNNTSNNNVSNPTTYAEDQAMVGSQPQHLQQGSNLVGPRPAPTYRVVNAVIEKEEDGPGPRCGHTLTAVAAVGEEGQPGYIGPRLILFGGATALEGNSAAASSPPASGGNSGISMSIKP